MSTGPSRARMALEVADWRRQVFALYADLRTIMVTDSPVAAHDHWRAGRDRLFADHPASPLLDRAGFTGLRVADYDPAFRFEVEIEPAEAADITVGTGTDGDVGFSRVGVVELPGLGRLDVWAHQGYGGGLFVPVRDATAGELTYGGGRYLIDTIKGADLGSVDRDGSDDGRLLADLNFAYNPSCVYDPAWACPLPQPGNTISTAVPVGELLP